VKIRRYRSIDAPSIRLTRGLPGADLTVVFGAFLSRCSRPFPRRLNAIRARLATLDWARTLVFEINGLKREELIATGLWSCTRSISMRFRSALAPRTRPSVFGHHVLVLDEAGFA
jgi:hypothetical protein